MSPFVIPPLKEEVQKTWMYFLSGGEKRQVSGIFEMLPPNGSYPTHVSVFNCLVSDGSVEH